MVNQIEQKLKEAWEKFFSDYYDKRVPRYRQNWELELQAENDHWICWDEHDLTFHIGRFFYDILKEKKECSSIEIHLDKKVDRKNFRGYRFEDKLDELKKKLIEEGVLKKEAPKVDIIIAKEDSNDSLLLCAEAKCFRYSTDWEKAVNNDIKKLRAYKDEKFGMAKKVVFMLFDDYYWRYKKQTANEIQKRLDEIRNEGGITVLFHTSEARLESHQQ
ncbi:MAG: hypothetical protein JW947_11005 [Sedimentisphaerales bacterium]|nr:hypothetical protein [Sedimentisphaerales bacterium]